MATVLAVPVGWAFVDLVDGSGAWWAVPGAAVPAASVLAALLALGTIRGFEGMLTAFAVLLFGLLQQRTPAEVCALPVTTTRSSPVRATQAAEAAGVGAPAGPDE